MMMSASSSPASLSSPSPAPPTIIDERGEGDTPVAEESLPIKIAHESDRAQTATTTTITSNNNSSISSDRIFSSALFTFREKALPSIYNRLSEGRGEGRDMFYLQAFSVVPAEMVGASREEEDMLGWVVPTSAPTSYIDTRSSIATSYSADEGVFDPLNRAVECGSGFIDWVEAFFTDSQLSAQRLLMLNAIQLALEGRSSGGEEPAEVQRRPTRDARRREEADERFLQLAEAVEELPSLAPAADLAGLQARWDAVTSTPLLQRLFLRRYGSMDAAHGGFNRHSCGDGRCGEEGAAPAPVLIVNIIHATTAQSHCCVFAPENAATSPADRVLSFAEFTGAAALKAWAAGALERHGLHPAGRQAEAALRAIAVLLQLNAPLPSPLSSEGPLLGVPVYTPIPHQVKKEATGRSTSPKRSSESSTASDHTAVAAAAASNTIGTAYGDSAASSLTTTPPVVVCAPAITVGSDRQGAAAWSKMTASCDSGRETGAAPSTRSHSTVPSSTRTSSDVSRATGHALLVAGDIATALAAYGRREAAAGIDPTPDASTTTAVAAGSVVELDDRLRRLEDEEAELLAALRAVQSCQLSALHGRIYRFPSPASGGGGGGGAGRGGAAPGQTFRLRRSDREAAPSHAAAPPSLSSSISSCATDSLSQPCSRQVGELEARRGEKMMATDNTTTTTTTASSNSSNRDGQGAAPWEDEPFMEGLRAEVAQLSRENEALLHESREALAVYRGRVGRSQRGFLSWAATALNHSRQHALFAEEAARRRDLAREQLQRLAEMARRSPLSPTCEGGQHSFTATRRTAEVLARRLQLLQGQALHTKQQHAALEERVRAVAAQQQKRAAAAQRRIDVEEATALSLVRESQAAAAREAALRGRVDGALLSMLSAAPLLLCGAGGRRADSSDGANPTAQRAAAAADRTASAVAAGGFSAAPHRAPAASALPSWSRLYIACANSTSRSPTAGVVQSSSGGGCQRDGEGDGDPVPRSAAAALTQAVGMFSARSCAVFERHGGAEQIASCSTSTAGKSGGTVALAVEPLLKACQAFLHSYAVWQAHAEVLGSVAAAEDQLRAVAHEWTLVRRRIKVTAEQVQGLKSAL